MSKINGLAILTLCVEQGFLCSIPHSELEKVIMKQRQVSDPRTIRQTITFLQVNDFLTESAPKIYKLNLTLISDIKDRQVTLTQAVTGVEA